MVAFLYGVIIVSILLLVNGIYQIAVGTPRKKALDEHHKLSWKLTNAGSETENLKRAKECYFQLLTSYEGVKGFANANERYCYEDDIDLIRDNAEMLAERRWASKADEYLLKMEEAHSLVVQHNFNNIEKAYSSKATFLKAYDAYFDWTRKCYDDNYGIWKSVKLWDEAKKCVTELLGETGEYVFWNSTLPSNSSVRQQIDANLTKHIESMRPECLRKIKLNSLILNKIASCGSIQRSILLKSSFDGFTAPEVQACYHGLVKVHDVIEAKQGSLYFVSLADAAATRYCQQQEKAVDECEKSIRQLDHELNKLVDALVEAPKVAHKRIYERMESLEAQKAAMESDLVKLRIAHDIRFTEEEVRAWLKKFCTGDLFDPEFRRNIIDVFINSVYLYDDRVIIFYNIKGGKQVSYIDVAAALDAAPNAEVSDFITNAPP